MDCWNDKKTIRVNGPTKKGFKIFSMFAVFPSHHCDPLFQSRFNNPVIVSDQPNNKLRKAFPKAEHYEYEIINVLNAAQKDFYLQKKFHL